MVPGHVKAQPGQWHGGGRHAACDRLGRVTGESTIWHLLRGYDTVTVAVNRLVIVLRRVAQSVILADSLSLTRSITQYCLAAVSMTLAIRSIAVLSFQWLPATPCISRRTLQRSCFASLLAKASLQQFQPQLFIACSPSHKHPHRCSHVTSYHSNNDPSKER